MLACEQNNEAARIFAYALIIISAPNLPLSNSISYRDLIFAAKRAYLSFTMNQLLSDVFT